MLTLQLHGSLGRDFGEHWCLDVKTFAEAIYAINAMTAKLFKQLLENDKSGITYRVVIGDKDFETTEDLKLPADKSKVYHVIPVLEGAGGEWWQQVLIGIGLIALSLVLPGISQIGLSYFLSNIIYTIGIALVLGGIAQLLSPSPKLDLGSGKKDEASTTFSGTRNTTNQGGPVPLLYGELIVGSQLIGLNVINLDV